jgi:hypothetical protein
MGGQSYIHVVTLKGDQLMHADAEGRRHVKDVGGAVANGGSGLL